MNELKLIKFYLEYKKLFEDNTGLAELWIDVGELTVKHDMTKEEVKYILDFYDTSFDFSQFLRGTYDNWAIEEDEDYIKLTLGQLESAMRLHDITNIDDKIRRIKDIINESV
jgi:hypothetical protein